MPRLIWHQPLFFGMCGFLKIIIIYDQSLAEYNKYPYSAAVVPALGTADANADTTWHFI